MAGYSQSSTPSLASATSSRLDSACKHIQQCRVSQDHMLLLAGNDEEDIIRNKYRYCCHKDDLILGVGKPWNEKDKRYSNNAYPRVISNLGKLADNKNNAGEANTAVKMIMYMYHNATSIVERNDLLKLFRGDRPTAFGYPNRGTPFFQEVGGNYGFVDAMKPIHDFVSVGYANTLGWAHAHTGDTMTSVMIGGLRTVMNGDFEVFCGDMIQWYWPFERECFTTNGRRRERSGPVLAVGAAGAPGVLTWSNANPAYADGVERVAGEDANQREHYYKKQFGQLAGVERCVPRIKPFKRDDEAPRLYDWYRVFAVAISSARAHEMVDIRISRQSL